MDTVANVNFTPQPAQPVTPPRLSVEQAAKPARTELDSAKSVAATIAPEPSTTKIQTSATDIGTAENGTASSDNSDITSAGERAVERSFEIDPGTETLIYRAINADSGDVVRQVPEEVFLKIRAYNAQSETGRAPAADPAVSDRASSTVVEAGETTNPASTEEA